MKDMSSKHLWKNIEKYTFLYGKSMLPKWKNIAKTM